MANSVLSEPYFQDEQAAFDRLEAIIWPHGIICPHCGTGGPCGRPLWRERQDWQASDRSQEVLRVPQAVHSPRWNRF
jgi:hypothetical protein